MSNVRRLRSVLGLTVEALRESTRERAYFHEYADTIAEFLEDIPFGRICYCDACGLVTNSYNGLAVICSNYSHCGAGYCKIHVPPDLPVVDYRIECNGQLGIDDSQTDDPYFEYNRDKSPRYCICHDCCAKPHIQYIQKIMLERSSS